MRAIVASDFVSVVSCNIFSVFLLLGILILEPMHFERITTLLQNLYCDGRSPLPYKSLLFKLCNALFAVGYRYDLSSLLSEFSSSFSAFLMFLSTLSCSLRFSSSLKSHFSFLCDCLIMQRGVSYPTSSPALVNYSTLPSLWRNGFSTFCFWSLVVSLMSVKKSSRSPNSPIADAQLL